VGADRLDNPPGADPGDLKAELYNLDATPYESLMLGLFTIWHSSGRVAKQSKINDVGLGFSRDGFHWDRPFREAVLSVSNEANTWNFGNVQSVGGGCLVVGDRLYLYSSGRRANEWSTGLWFLRRDGFASMVSGERAGTLTTRHLRFSGRRLFVNLEAPRGGLQVEVLNREGRVIAPFTKEACTMVTGDRTQLEVRWGGAADLGQLAGEPVHLRFHLKNGALYSFWISPDASGASHG